MVGAIVPGFLVASLVPHIRQDFAFSDSTLGLGLALFYAASALAAAPAGRLIDRIGAVSGVRLAAAVVALSALAIAALAGSALVLIALLAVIGAGKALAGPGVGALVARRVRERRRGLALGLKTSGAPASALLAGLALPLVAAPLGWRWAFVAAAALIVASAAAVPRSAPAASDDAPEPAATAVALRPVRVLAVASALASAAGLGFFSFLVVYAVDAGLEPAEAGLLLSATSVVAVVSRLVQGAAADRQPGADILRRTTALLLLCAVGLALVATGLPALIAIGAFAGVGVGWGWQALANLFVVRATPETPGTAMGIQVSGFFVGAVAGPLLVGLLADGGLFALAWLTCAVLATLAAVAVAVARRLQQPATSHPPSRISSEMSTRSSVTRT